MCILHIVNVETPLRRQKSWADYNAAIRNTYIKEDDEVSQKFSDEDSQKPSDSRKGTQIHTHTYTQRYTHVCTHPCIHTCAYTHTHANNAKYYVAEKNTHY